MASSDKAPQQQVAQLKAEIAKMQQRTEVLKEHIRGMNQQLETRRAGLESQKAALSKGASTPEKVFQIALIDAKLGLVGQLHRLGMIAAQTLEDRNQQRALAAQKTVALARVTFYKSELILLDYEQKVSVLKHALSIPNPPNLGKQQQEDLEWVRGKAASTPPLAQQLQSAVHYFGEARNLQTSSGERLLALDKQCTTLPAAQLQQGIQESGVNKVAGQIYFLRRIADAQTADAKLKAWLTPLAEENLTQYIPEVAVSESAAPARPRTPTGGSLAARLSAANAGNNAAATTAPSPQAAAQAANQKNVTDKLKDLFGL